MAEMYNKQPPFQRGSAGRRQLVSCPASKTERSGAHALAKRRTSPREETRVTPWALRAEPRGRALLGWHLLTSCVTSGCETRLLQTSAPFLYMGKALSTLEGD